MFFTPLLYINLSFQHETNLILSHCKAIKFLPFVQQFAKIHMVIHQFNNHEQKPLIKFLFQKTLIIIIIWETQNYPVKQLVTNHAS